MPVLIRLRKELWTGLISVGDQVPTCPVFTRAKIKSRLGILDNLPSQYSLSLSQFKERRKKRRKGRETFIVMYYQLIIWLTRWGCVSACILKRLLYFNVPHVLKFVHCVACFRVAYFMFLFSASFALCYSRLNCPILFFKNIIRETGVVDYYN